MILGLLLALSAPAAALTNDHEVFSLIGWNKQCSFAFEHYVYPKLGEAFVDDPIEARVGTLTIPGDSQESEERLTLSLSGARSWEPVPAKKAREKLVKEGYSLAGWVETLRPDSVVARRDLERLLLSTDTFRTKAEGWPKAPWRASTIYYSPFTSDCAMMLYTRGAGKKFFKPVLFRVENPTIRSDRALAHVTNGLLLLEKGDDEGALAEETIAATMAPDFAPARYHHAALLVLSGQWEPAVDELAAAVELDSKYREKARKDKDFASLRWHPRFGELTR